MYKDTDKELNTGKGSPESAENRYPESSDYGDSADWSSGDSADMSSGDSGASEVPEGASESSGSGAPAVSKAASTLMYGATILAIAGIVSKIFGAIFRIPLTNMIGAEGQSYYGAAYPVYQLFYVVATAGFPVAISRMVSERVAKGDYINAEKSYSLALKATFIISSIAFCICFFGAGVIAGIIKNPGAEASIRAISIALFFTPFVASLRGYFQGNQIMEPTAVSQVIEQIIRVATGLVLAFMFYKTNLQYAAAGATFGASAGMIAAMFVLFYIRSRYREQRKANIKKSVMVNETTRERLRELFRIVIPITIGSAIIPLMMTIDAAVIMRRLQATGWNLAESQKLYGLISGYCDPLVNLPVVFIDAICISLIPAVTRAFTLKIKSDLDGNVRTGLKTMMIIAVPCTIGLISLAKPILTLLYYKQQDEAIMAVPTMQILAFGIITLAVMRTLSSSLQGIGKVNQPVINLFIGAVVKIAITYVLVGIPGINIKGAAVGTVAAYLTAAILNYRDMRKYVDLEIDFAGVFARPFLAAAIMGVSAIMIYHLVYALHPSNLIATAVAIMCAVFVYFVMVFLTKAITKEEITLVPKGELIWKIATKMHLAK